MFFKKNKQKYEINKFKKMKNKSTNQQINELKEIKEIIKELPNLLNKFVLNMKHLTTNILKIFLKNQK